MIGNSWPIPISIVLVTDTLCFIKENVRIWYPQTKLWVLQKGNKISKMVVAEQETPHLYLVVVVYPVCCTSSPSFTTYRAFIILIKAPWPSVSPSRSCPSQAGRLTLHPIDGAPSEELPALNPEQLEELGNPDVIKNEIALLEDRCSNMKPNLGSILEFKKKVRAPALGSCDLFIFWSHKCNDLVS